MTTYFHDALRSLRRTPGLNVLVMVIVAVATGVNIAIFNAVNRVLLEPLPVRDAEDVFVLGEQDPRPLGEISYLDVGDWRRLNTSFVDMGAMGPSNWNGELAGRGEPITVAYRAVSGSTSSACAPRSDAR